MAITWTRVDKRSTRGVSAALSESIPSGSDDGLNLDGVSSVRLVVEAPAGQTFDGTGTWRCAYRSPHAEAWGRHGDADLEMPATASGLGRWVFPAVPVSLARGHVAYYPDTIGASGGAALTWYLEAGGKQGENL